MDVDAPVLAVVYLIVSDDRIAVGADLDACQGISVYVIVLNQTAAFTKNINAALVSIVNFIPTNGWIRVGRDPHAGKIVRMNPVLDELSLARFVHVDTTRLTVVNFATYHSWVCSSYWYNKRIRRIPKPHVLRRNDGVPFTSKPAILLL